MKVQLIKILIFCLMIACFKNIDTSEFGVHPTKKQEEKGCKKKLGAKQNVIKLMQKEFYRQVGDKIPQAEKDFGFIDFDWRARDEKWWN